MRAPCTRIERGERNFKLAFFTAVVFEGLFFAAFLAAAGVACFDRWGGRLHQPTAAFSEGEAATAGIAGVFDEGTTVHLDGYSCCI